MSNRYTAKKMAKEIEKETEGKVEYSKALVETRNYFAERKAGLFLLDVEDRKNKYMIIQKLLKESE